MQSIKSTKNLADKKVQRSKAIVNVNNDGGTSSSQQVTVETNRSSNKGGQKRGRKYVPDSQVKRRKNNSGTNVDAQFVEDGKLTNMHVESSLSEDMDSVQSEDDSEYGLTVEEEGECSNNNVTMIKEKVNSQNDSFLGKQLSQDGSAQSSIDANEKEEIIGETVVRVKDVFVQSGFFETANFLKQQLLELKESTKTGKSINDLANMNLEEQTAHSEVTVYRNAVMDGMQSPQRNRGSSSSEELINTSNELEAGQNDNIGSKIDKFISEQRKSNLLSVSNLPPPPPRTTPLEGNKGYGGAGSNTDDDEPRLSTSRRRSLDVREELNKNKEERADRLVHEVELGKAKIFQTPGKERVLNIENSLSRDKMLVHSMMVDEDYLIVASHIDENAKLKISNGEYVDFAKLLPKDRILEEEEVKLQMTIKNGQTFWTPMNDNKTLVTSLRKWEQAFRVYSDIYV